MDREREDPRKCSLYIFLWSSGEVDPDSQQTKVSPSLVAGPRATQCRTP